MTNKEQTISNLKKLKSFHNGSYGADIDRAIKALAHEPVLDKIRAEIERQEKWLMDAGYTAYNVDIAFSSIRSAVAESEGDHERLLET